MLSDDGCAAIRYNNAEVTERGCMARIILLR